MSKVKSVFVCQSCGTQYSKWQGQCAQCGEWNTLVEEMVEAKKGKPASAKGTSEARLVRWSEIEKTPLKENERFSTGSHEFDRVLGGGVVPGSVVLLAGEPGMGKSTLLTQLSLQASRFKPQTNVQTKTEVMYVCGEESVEQVALRVRRLQKARSVKPEANKISFLSSTNVDVIVETARREKPSVLIVDSIQTLSTEDLTGMSGSVGQVRESAARLVRLAKDDGIATFIVGHVTKEGGVAGPKVLEHMVDVVIELTGERTGLYRLLRNLKNRFGAVDEVGVLEMQEQGLLDVDNPSSIFLEEAEAKTPGRAVAITLEGMRSVLVEVQALAVASNLPQPRRVAQGVSLSKVQVILAVLQKWCRIPTATHDVFVSVVGGLKLNDPGADLAIAIAIASSILGKAVNQHVAVVGEVGLLGEIRRVPQLSKRITEAKRLGYSQVIEPGKGNHIVTVVKELLGK